MSLLTNVLKLWRTGQYLLPADSGFSPKHLLAGRVGWWLDPLDFRYAWQDSAGTTPYAAVEQYAGLLLSKAVPQVSNGTARVNIIADSTNFASTANCVITNNKFVATAASGYHNYNTSALAPGAVYKIKLKVKAAEYTKLYIADLSNGNFAVAVDLVALTYSGAQRTATNISVTSLGSGIVEVQLTVTDIAGGVSVVGVVGYPSTGATLNFWGAQYTGDGVSGLYVYAVDVRLLSDEAALPAYQRIDNNVWVPYSSGCFYQATSAARPVVSARVNLLLETGNMLASRWALGGGYISKVAGTGTSIVVSRSAGASSNYADILQYNTVGAAGVNVGKTYVFSVELSSPTPINASLVVSDANYNSYSVSVAIDSTPRRYSFTSAGGAGWNPSGTNIGVGLSFPVGASGVVVNEPQLTTIQNAHLPYQHVNTATDYDTAGFPHYLKFDGATKNLVGASGGGASTGFYFGAAVQFGKVGAVQTIVSDAGTNTGFKIRTTAANQIEISAGNGAAFTAVNTTETFAAGDVAFIELFDNGTNLSACLGNGTPATVARPAVSAGTAQMTLGKANNTASEYSGVSIFSAVYLKDYCPTAAERADYKRWALQRAGVAS